MSDEPVIARVCGPAAAAVVDIIFIHGLSGDPYETWVSQENSEFWPSWLCVSFGNVGVYTVGYPTSLFEKFAAKEMDIHERASNLLEHLASFGFGKRPIIFVCHSLGGLLAKEILRTSKECLDDGWRQIATNTRLVCFLGTPHTGSSMASVITTCVPRMASNTVALLTNESGYLSNLNQAFREYATTSGALVVSYYEKWKTKNVAIVVSRDSADPGAGASRPIGVDADHLTICKPKNKTALIYVSLCRHIVGVIEKVEVEASPYGDTTFDADDYRATSENDRRDLLQKMIDAGREYEYQTANDMQNKFAQKYNRLGLFSEAKSKSDNLLSEVHQRFVTHVYNAKICRGADDDTIKEALQEYVITPLCSGVPATKRPSFSAVLQALYFLTEQCHIRWDAPK